MGALRGGTPFSFRGLKFAHKEFRIGNLAKKDRRVE